MSKKMKPELDGLLASGSAKKEISFDHLGGRKLQGSLVPDRSAKPVNLSAAYGHTGKLVCKAPESDAPEESTGDDNTD
jgi:hypothetical protein